MIAHSYDVYSKGWSDGLHKNTIYTHTHTFINIQTYTHHTYIHTHTTSTALALAHMNTLYTLI